MTTEEYQCVICNNSTFKSRADWLVHLVLSRHSGKVARRLEKWISLKRKEDLYLITNLDLVDNSLLLEYISDNLRTFSDIVFFKPRANICLAVGNETEWKEFCQREHQVTGTSLQFKPYSQITQAEWATYFPEACTSKIVEPTLEGNFVDNPGSLTLPLKRKLDESPAPADAPQKSAKVISRICPPAPRFQFASTPTTIPPTNEFSGNNATIASKTNQLKVDNTKNRLEADKAELTHTKSQVRRDNAGFNDTKNQLIGNHPAFPPKTNQKPNPQFWKQELDEIENKIFMTSAQLESRKSVITHLTDMFKQGYPNCKIIPIGADILGFNLEQTAFKVYFDSKGLSDPQTGDGAGVFTVDESHVELEKLKTSVFSKLNALQSLGILSELQLQGPHCVSFSHLMFDLKCTLFLKPFMKAQTARLCKHLYSANESTAAILNMVVYWTMLRKGFSEIGLINPFVVYWLVYFFFMKKSVLPPVINMQKSCPYQVVDRQHNVAFSCDESVFSSAINVQKCNKENALTYVNLLLEWFVFIDDTLGETNGKGINRRHSLVCPRFVQLMDKRMFKICWETLRGKKKHLYKDQKKVRQLWRQNLIDIGFEEAMWENLLGLKLPDTLSIQHPLYVSENISLSFDGPFSKRFFEAIKKTRSKLSRLVAGDPSMTKLVQALSPA